MSGCLTDTRQDLLRRVDGTVTRLAPEVAALLESLSPGDETRAHREDGAYVLSIPVRFPDGVGRGVVVARVFRYRNVARVDLELVHNRVLADASGAATNRQCFLNDFVASTSLPADADGLSEQFRRRVAAGVRAALHAVETHNRRHPEPWSQVRVVAQ